MILEGFTTCVGEKYAGYLNRSVNIWTDTLDNLTIATDAETVGFFSDRARRFAHVTDIFTAHGASFNKGAALSQAFAQNYPQEYVVNFDSDILPPADWREIVEARLKNPEHRNKLLGCSHRHRENGSLISDADYPNIWGFFHVWSIADAHSWVRPVFDSTCGHAGNYDHTFMMQWEPAARVDLWPRLKLIHQGEPREQWFGRDPKNQKKMVNLFTLGLWDAWLTRAGHINAPEPERIVEISRLQPLEFVLKELKDWTATDPFKYKVTVK